MFRKLLKFTQHLSYIIIKKINQDLFFIIPVIYSGQELPSLSSSSHQALHPFLQLSGHTGSRKKTQKTIQVCTFGVTAELHKTTYTVYDGFQTTCLNYDNLTLCFSISATISAILCWHFSSVSSLFLMASAAVNLCFSTCEVSLFLYFFIKAAKENIINEWHICNILVQLCSSWKNCLILTRLNFKHFLSILRTQIFKKDDHTSISNWLDFAISVAICFFNNLFWKYTKLN